jgi:hypothetical protein
MSAVLETQQENSGDMNSRLEFFKKLQVVTNKIHVTANIDEIMLDLSLEICSLFNCDRFTFYAVSDDKAFIVSKIKTGLNTFNNLTLPISEQSIAGHAAFFKKIIRLNDLYDAAELKSYTPALHFLQEVDKHTGYRTRQLLAAPLINVQNNELLGVRSVLPT